MYVRMYGTSIAPFFLMQRSADIPALYYTHFRTTGTASNNFPLRGGKNTLWEGGTRVVGAVRGPGIPSAGDGTIHYRFVAPFRNVPACCFLPRHVAVCLGGAGLYPPVAAYLYLAPCYSKLLLLFWLRQSVVARRVFLLPVFRSAAVAVVGAACLRVALLLLRK